MALLFVKVNIIAFVLHQSEFTDPITSLLIIMMMKMMMMMIMSASLYISFLLYSRQEDCVKVDAS